jgi:type 1 glutamine amidotransferase
MRGLKQVVYMGVLAMSVTSIPVQAEETAATMAQTGPLKVLLLTGQNNHDWKNTTPVIQSILEKNGAFSVTVDEKPADLKAGAFSAYDVILSNWNTFPKNPPGVWDSATRADFINYIESGKGFVVVHAGGAMFYDWPEYQKLIGATWGKTSTHGKIFPFKVAVTDSAHPVTQGMPPLFETVDEIWARMAVNGERHILLTAPSDRTKKDEAVCFTTTYGQGRCFNLVLGAEAGGIKNSWFQTLLRRGCEWAATGAVSARTLKPVE